MKRRLFYILLTVLGVVLFAIGLQRFESIKEVFESSHNILLDVFEVDLAFLMGIATTVVGILGVCFTHHMSIKVTLYTWLGIAFLVAIPNSAEAVNVVLYVLCIIVSLVIFMRVVYLVFKNALERKEYKLLAGVTLCITTAVLYFVPIMSGYVRLIDMIS